MIRLAEKLVLLFGVALALVAAPAVADDWQATRLRGAVFALENGAWEQLVRGDVVADDRVIRTARNGRVLFERGSESINLGPDTQIQIHDRNGQKFTTVQQYFGALTVEADQRDVQHFAVQTPLLAAVVKGTKFKVTVTDDNSEVRVLRGSVEVRDRTSARRVAVSRGQRAKVSDAVGLEAFGDGVVLVTDGEGATDPTAIEDLPTSGGDDTGETPDVEEGEVADEGDDADAGTDDDGKDVACKSQGQGIKNC